MHINLIARTNGVGLDADVELLKRALTDKGYEVSVSHSRGKSFMGKLFGKKNQFDANIFLERAFPNWFKSAPINLLIPNQERYPHRHLDRLKKIDYVLCKTRHAEELFKAQGANTKLIGFTSKDVHLKDQFPSYQRIFHLAGRSTLKGTETILQLWEKHPEWPQLTLVQHKHNAPESVPENVNLITDYLPYNDLIKFYNKCGIHLCPSLSEGWGHYIVEAMSTGAVVITTDAPPMNELVNEENGLTVAYHKSEPRHLGTNFFVDPAKLEANIIKVLEMSTEKKEALGKNAKAWYDSNHQSFSETLPKTIGDILGSNNS